MTMSVSGETSTREISVMTVWPSVARYAVARFLGSLYSLNLGFYVLRLGNIIALATAPIGAILYLLRVAPFIGTRYRVTNQRIIVERGLTGKEQRSVQLDRFDNIETVVRPGQSWFNAGDLIFRLGKTETFRLEAVSRPESFRQICLKSHQACVGVAQAMNKRSRGISMFRFLDRWRRLRCNRGAMTVIAGRESWSVIAETPVADATAGVLSPSVTS